jgi:hypothetical protein
VYIPLKAHWIATIPSVDKYKHPKATGHRVYEKDKILSPTICDRGGGNPKDGNHLKVCRAMKP